MQTCPIRQQRPPRATSPFQTLPNILFKRRLLTNGVKSIKGWNLCHRDRKMSTKSSNRQKISNKQGSANVGRPYCLYYKTTVLPVYYSGMDAPPRGEGGFLAPPRTVGKGGFPTPPRPIKMIKMAGKLQGKIKARISTFSNKGNQWWNNITTLNNGQSCPILPIGYARKSKKWKYLLILC